MSEADVLAQWIHEGGSTLDVIALWDLFVDGYFEAEAAAVMVEVGTLAARTQARGVT